MHSGYDPIDSNLQDRADRVLAVEREAAPAERFRSIARVPSPGPGDGIGTLDVWMIDDEIIYSWVC